MGKAGAKYTQLSQNEFDIIKGLQKNFKSSQIEKLTGRSSATVHYIFNSETMDDYKKTVRDIHERRLARQQMQSPAVDDFDVDSEPFEVKTEPTVVLSADVLLHEIRGMLVDMECRLENIEKYVSGRKSKSTALPVTTRKWWT